MTVVGGPLATVEEETLEGLADVAFVGAVARSQSLRCAVSGLQSKKQRAGILDVSLGTTRLEPDQCDQAEGCNQTET